MEYVFTLDKHKKEPGKSLDEYVREKRLELAGCVTRKQVVYLDTKFWLILRDANTRRGNNDIAKELLALTVQLSESGVCIFPVSEDVFLEVLKQTDKRTLKATIELIDKLSGGVSLISFDERVRQEILHFMYEKNGEDVYRLDELVWTKLSYTMGFVTPSNPILDGDQGLVLQKAFFDQMWSMTLRDLNEVMESNGGIDGPDLPDISPVLNKGKFGHENENISFKQMFLSELAGFLDIYKREFTGMMSYMNENKTGKTATKDELQKDDSEQMIANMVYNLFRLNKIGTELPTYRICSALHAAVRWDREQKYQANDMHDFRHAAAALPYCDYFFTEKRLCHLITQKSLDYGRFYDCNVQSSIQGAYEAILSINI